MTTITRSQFETLLKLTVITAHTLQLAMQTSIDGATPGSARISVPRDGAEAMVSHMHDLKEMLTELSEYFEEEAA